MNELIPLHQQTINSEMVQTVSARELHAFLEVQTAFKDWIARRIVDYDFDDGIDFCSILSESSGGRPSREYYITLDMAKELAMVERNEKGKQARKYFIECEKQLKSKQLPPQPQLPVQPIGEVEDKLRTIILALDHSSISPAAKETAIITSAETLTGISIGYRPQIEQTTYSAKELGDVLGISANRVGRIANAHNLKTDDYGLYYLSKSQYSEKQVEQFRYFEKALDKFKAILANE